MAPPSEVRAPASNDPKIGPVHENDTKASVRAIKKIPKQASDTLRIADPVRPTAWKGDFVESEERKGEEYKNDKEKYIETDIRRNII